MSKKKYKRKHILLKNEIQGIINQLKGICYYSEQYIDNLTFRLEQLKKKWYKRDNRKKPRRRRTKRWLK